MDSLNSVWQSILAEISKNITSTAYNTWFADCSPVELGETNMVIQTTSDFKRSVITSRFGEVIRAALRSSPATWTSSCSPPRSWRCRSSGTT